MQQMQEKTLYNAEVAGLESALSTNKVNQGIDLDQGTVNKNADKHGVTSSKPSGTTIAGVSVEETSLDEEYHEEKLPRPGEEMPPNENVNC